MGVQERRQREREARRKAVLDAARDLVRERGYNGTTTKQIAAACELSEATLFWYFKSKDEIFTSLLFEAIDFMQQRIDALGSGSSTADGMAVPTGSAVAEPTRLLAGIWGVFTELRAGYPEYFQVFTSLASPEATAAVSAEVKAELVRRSGENFRRVADLIASAIVLQSTGVNAGAGGSGGQTAAVPHRPSQPEVVWTRIATDVLWAAFLGLGVLHDSRVNLGATAHPTPPELDQALQVLIAGIAPGFTRTAGPSELGPEGVEPPMPQPPRSRPEEYQ